LKYAANFVTKPVVNLLRSAPEQDYVFQGAPDSQMAVKTAFATDGAVRKRQPLIVPHLDTLPAPQTPNYQVQNYGHSYSAAPDYAPVQMVEAAPTASLAQPQPTDDVSFVKIGGGSNMNDWLACEAQAGGFIRVTQSGYLVDPAFESCMRAKGYKPESEVADLIGFGTEVSL